MNPQLTDTIEGHVHMFYCTKHSEYLHILQQPPTKPTKSVKNPQANTKLFKQCKSKMSTSALVGYSGFVGSNLHSQHTFTYLFNSQNIELLKNQCFDLLVCAAPSAVKWVANKNPEDDLKVIESLINILMTVKTDKLILISTIDVYSVEQVTNPSIDEPPTPDNSYGHHRLHLETKLRERFGEKLTVVRLPALFGPGLKKNCLYDLLHNHRTEFVIPNSIFSFYNISNLWEDICRSWPQPVVNLFPCPIIIADIISSSFPHALCASPIDKPITYLAHTPETCSQTKQSILKDIDQWVHAEICGNRLSFSQIGMGPIAPRDWACHRQVLQVNGFDFVPTMSASWDSNPSIWIPYLSLVKHVQSISFGVSEDILSGAFLDHYAKSVCDIYSKMPNLKTITIGSPKSRISRHGVVNQLRLMADLTPSGVALCLEINPREYGAQWGNTIHDCIRIVKLVAKDNVGITVDTGCTYMAHKDMDPSEVVSACSEYLRHFHVSLPNMDKITKDSFSLSLHQRYSQALLLSGYKGDITVEQSKGTLADATTALNIVRQTYLYFLII